MSYSVRVEDRGQLVREVACESFGASLAVALDLSRQYPKLSVSPYNAENVDLGCPTGLTRDEREAWDEVSS